MASAAVDTNQQSDSSLASKSIKLHGQMKDSIAGDNQSNERINEAAVKCKHFSIRGYVAEVRKRNPKLCDPFSSYVSRDGSMETTKHELPPMVVPKFRWWQCDSCVPGAATSEGAAKEAQKSADVPDVPIPLIQQITKVDAPRERNAEASTSTDSNDNKIDAAASTVCADRKGKGKAYAEDEAVPVTGCENGFLKDYSSRGVLHQTTGGIDITSPVDNEVVPRSRCFGNGSSGSRQKNCKSDGIEVGSSKRPLNPEDDNSNQTSPVKQVASLGARHADGFSNGEGTQEVAGIFYGPSGNAKGRIVSLPDLNEFNGEPCDDDNNEALVTGNNNLCEEDDDYLGADRRKTPKVRLLSELLGLPENHSDAKLKKKNPSFSSFPGPAAFKSPLPMNENGKRKRAISQDDESKSVEIKGSNIVTKKPRTPQVQVSESDSEDESAEIISEALTKRRSRPIMEKNPVFEKRSKKFKIDHGGPSMPRQKNISKSSQEKGKSSEKLSSVDFAIVKPSHGAHSDRITDMPRKIDASAHSDERNLVLNKAKGKMLQAGKEHAPNKNHVPRDNPVTAKDIESVQKANRHVRNEPSHDGSTGRGTYRFSDNYFTVGNDHICIPPAKNGLYLSPCPAESMLLNGGIVTKHTENRYVGPTNLTFKASGTASFVGNRFDGNRERSTGPKSNSKGKQVWIPETDEGGPVAHHSLKQVSKAIVNQKELTNEVRGRIQDIDINSIPIDDKVPEQGSTGDDNHDIPMDIVELMAKNQYERNLSDPKDMHQPTSVANYGKTVKSTGSSFAYGESMSTFGQPHYLSMQNPMSSSDARNGMMSRYEDMVPSRQKLLGGPFSDFNQSHANIRAHVRENQAPIRSLSSGQGPEPLSAYSNHGLVPSSMNRLLAQGCLPSFFQAMDSYDRYRAPSPRPNVNARVWPSMVASRMPLGITNREMVSQSSSFMNKGRMHHQGPNILNFSAVNQGKQKANFPSAYNSGHVESSASGARSAGKQKGADYSPKPVGSGDLYSNEAIPAMHLLSLMQNAAKTSSLSTDGKTEVLKRPPNPPDQQYKQHTGNQESGLLKVGPSSSRQPLLENNCRTMQETSCHPCYPAFPPARTYASPFQNDGRLGRNVSFISPIPLTSRGQRNMEGSHFVTLGGDHPYRPQKSVPCDVGRKRPLASALDKGKVAGMSYPSSVNPLPASKVSPNYTYAMTARRDEKITGPNPNSEICPVNRNPSEFNDLRELVKYTLGPEDLRRRGASREKPGRPRGDAKRQELRMNKAIPPAKERDRLRKP